jgi:hypothetical protein
VEARKAAAHAHGGVARALPLAPRLSIYGDDLELAHGVLDELGHIHSGYPEQTLHDDTALRLCVLVEDHPTTAPGNTLELSGEPSWGDCVVLFRRAIGFLGASALRTARLMGST